MELPMRFMILLMLALIVLVAILIGVIGPLNSGVEDSENIADRTVACNKWNVKMCSDSSLTDEIKNAVGCSGPEECRKICGNLGFC